MESQKPSKYIEIILSPVRKSWLKSFVYNLFVKFDIDDENDVKRIEYLSTHKNNRGDLYDECRISFVNETGKHFIEVLKL